MKQQQLGEFRFFDLCCYRAIVVLLFLTTGRIDFLIDGRTLLLVVDTVGFGRCVTRDERLYST